MAESARRLFFALWPSPEVARRLYDTALSLQRDCGGRAMRRDSLHLTLAFLGAVPVSRVADAAAAADTVAADHFSLELDRVSCWKHNRVAWIGCSEAPAALLGLAADLAEKLRASGLELETRPFAAHATLLRNADCTAALPPLATTIVWPVEDFALVESHTGPGGSRYEVVRRWAMH